MEQNALVSALMQHAVVKVKQKKELIELIGFESRNKYVVTTESGQQLAFCAEQGKGLMGTIFRNVLGHWRTFELHFFDTQKQPIYIAKNPFRFLFQRMELYSAKGDFIGALQRRFAFLHKKFDVEDARGQVLMTVSSPLWRLWTFRFEKDGQERALIEKKWGGLIKEAFTDADQMNLSFKQSSLGPQERLLLLASAVFIDLVWFEEKAKSVFGGNSSNSNAQE